MSPHTFKVFLTIYFSIGIVTSLIGQAVNLYWIASGRGKKLVFQFAWIVNAVIIYGFWHWL